MLNLLFKVASADTSHVMLDSGFWILRRIIESIRRKWKPVPNNELRRFSTFFFYLML